MRAKELIQQRNNLPVCDYTKVSNLSMARTRGLLAMVGKMKSYASAIRIYVHKNKEINLEHLLTAIQQLLEKLSVWSANLKRNCLMAGIENHVYVGLKKWANEAEKSCIDIIDCVGNKKHKTIRELLNICYMAVASMFKSLSSVTKVRQYWFVADRQRLENKFIADKKILINALNNGAATRKREEKQQQNMVVRLKEMLNAV